jgi:hypothetical protein
MKDRHFACLKRNCFGACSGRMLILFLKMEIKYFITIKKELGLIKPFSHDTESL